MKLIGLVDCNNFFVSCERLFRPDLQKVPVVVLSSNDGCVVARSKEVKELGVPMGVPLFQVRELFVKEGVVTFSSNFALYRDISSRVMATLKEEVGYVEQYSVDEAFCIIDVADVATAHERARSIKARVEREVGVPVSVGVAQTKTIAKCATDGAKKGSGTAVLTGDTWRARTYEIPLSSVWGIGGKTAQKMRTHELTTVADLCAADSARIERLFGVHGARLQSELSEQPVHERSDGQDLQKSIMHTRSFKEATKQKRVLLDAVAYHTARAAEELRELGAVCQTIRVIAYPSRHGNWALAGGVLMAMLDVPTNDTRVLLHHASALLDALYERGVPYKKAGVVLSDIVPVAVTATPLFDTVGNDTSAVMTTVDMLNSKFGNDAVTVGRVSRARAWQPRTDHISPHYTTSWSDIPQVVA